VKFSAADMTAILSATGGPVTIGTTPAVGKFKPIGKLAQMYDGSFSTTGPTLRLSETDAALITEISTTITIETVAYQCIKKHPVGNGFVECELTKDF